MAYQLAFNTRHVYNSAEAGITVEVVISHGDRRQRLAAKLDTGSSFCIFPREYGESLGLDIESGEPESVGTATGSFQVYGHRVGLSTLGLQFEALVYFAAEPRFSRSVLGRRGWMERLRVGIVDYDGELYLSAYDDAAE